MNKVMKEIISTLAYVLGVLCLTWLVITFVGQRTAVDGSSMEPMLSDGDNLLVDKITYRFREPQRYDIIVFPPQYEVNTYYIKRIIGLPGETVRIDLEGNIYINDEILPENYGREIISPDKVGRATKPVVLGEDEYFVLGDNRNNSEDSRYANIGNVKKEHIEGKAWLLVSPLERFGLIR